VTEAEILARIEELTKARANALANVNALNGAIEDSEFWLARVRAAAPAPKLEVVRPTKRKET